MHKLFYGCLLLLLAPFLLLILLVIVATQFNGRVEAETRVSSSRYLDQAVSSSGPLTLRVMTYNIHDLYLAANRAERMRAIGEVVTQHDPDIVGFQEAFIAKDRKLLKEALAQSRLKHFEYFRSGTAGSGLLIASAWPIQETFFHRYAASNPWYKLWEGDWWAGKGVALARIETPAGLLDFYDTHAQAGYGNPEYVLVRESQMTGLAGFVRTSHLPAVPGFLVGDMNCRPGGLDYETARRGAGLIRTLDHPPCIDNIFALDSPAYTYTLIETKKIPEKIERNNASFELSDHDGFISVIRVVPKGA